jgi:hypothetical protein
MRCEQCNALVRYIATSMLLAMRPGKWCARARLSSNAYHREDIPRDNRSSRPRPIFFTFQSIFADSRYSLLRTLTREIAKL